jgi:DNA polymerase III subunit epsilon
MSYPIQLSRPLAVVDLETTGTAPLKDRIIEIGIVRIEIDGTRRTKCRRINPEIPIPRESTSVHKISDSDVANEPTFRQIAKSLRDEWLSNCDLCGYNIVKFDLPMLRAEFMRANVSFPIEDLAIVDPFLIYQRFEKRDLETAVHYFLNRAHVNSHNALADAIVTADILEVMVQKYSDLPKTPEAIYQTHKLDKYEDLSGKFRWVNGELTVNFGRRRGEPVAKVLSEDRSFFEWMMNEGDFPRDTKKVCWNILNGKQIMSKVASEPSNELRAANVSV